MAESMVPGGAHPMEGSPSEQEGFDVCSLQELRAARGLAFDFYDAKEFAAKYYPVRHRVAVYWDGSNVYASDDSCPHAQASLARSYVGPGRVECSAHHAVFDLATGECLDKYTRDVVVYRAELKGDRVVVYTPGLVR